MEIMYTVTNIPQCKSQLYMFEDIEAVIKMIVTGPNPTMRNVTRSHRIALDWLFDRINLEPKIHIRYADTKRQLADTLTPGSFSPDERNHSSSLIVEEYVCMYVLL